MYKNDIRYYLNIINLHAIALMKIISKVPSAARMYTTNISVK